MQTRIRAWNYLRKVAWVTLILVVVIASLAALYIVRGLHRARGYAAHQLWSHARAELRPYLRLRPRDAEANLLMAEALIKDERLPGSEAIPIALEHLRRVPKDSPYAARALTQEGRIHLLLLDQPARAQECLQAAIQLDKNLLDAHYMLWKLYDLTGRSHQVEPIFWQVYQLSPATDRGVRLREWYMSQFFPRTANPRLEVAMGFIAPGQLPTSVTEANRLIRFRRAEPDRALPHVALARWFQQEGDPQYARELLQDTQKRCSIQNDSFFIATMVSVLIDLGEFEEAEKWWQQWPQPLEGYDYWLWTGVIHEQVRRDDKQAVAAYAKALSIWPGHADWQTRHRYMNCLQRLGQRDLAEQQRTHSKRIEKLSENELHEQLRAALNGLDNPGPLQLVVQFYEDLGREQEAACWREYIAQIGIAKSISSS